ncbi:MAG: hypothetical protein K1X57_00835 [Gemmataceae bacterium]|nr:hypothetical protein [Gemmataceae bacterium]
MSLPCFQAAEATLVDLDAVHVSEQAIRVTACALNVLVFAAGYGDAKGDDPYGVPVVIEQRNGELFVKVWDDINNARPSHVICLKGARLSNRHPK